MRLVPKLALTLLAGVFTVVATFTAYRVYGEIKIYDADVRRDHRIIGLTAAAALAKTRTPDEAVRLARRVDATRENLRVSYVSLAEAPRSELSPIVSFAGRPKLAPGAWMQVIAHPEGKRGGPGELVTYVGAPIVDQPLGAIQIAESLAPRAAYISRGIWSVFASSVAMLLVCGLLVALIGARMVGGPVAELIAAARKIGAGDFQALGPVQRKDEFGELARAMRSMSADLETARQRMQDETEARIRALEQLRHAERLATLGQLASVLAHEVGTPLNVIAGHAKMIATGRLFGNDSADSAVAIGAQCERMTLIVRRILDYARRRPARRAWIHASDLMQQASELLSGFAAQRKVTLALDGSSDLKLWADPDQLQQAITNLLMNAIQASDAGQTVRLSARACDAPGVSDAGVVLSIQDHGSGIAEEVRDRIFEPFFTTKPPGEGTGLGLSVVHDIVHEHGGKVEFSSRAGEGSLFEVILPRGTTDGSSSTHR